MISGSIKTSGSKVAEMPPNESHQEERIFFPLCYDHNWKEKSSGSVKFFALSNLPVKGLSIPMILPAGVWNLLRPKQTVGFVTL